MSRKILLPDGSVGEIDDKLAASIDQTLKLINEQVEVHKKYYQEGKTVVIAVNSSMAMQGDAATMFQSLTHYYHEMMGISSEELMVSLLQIGMRVASSDLVSWVSMVGNEELAHKLFELHKSQVQ